MQRIKPPKIQLYPCNGLNQHKFTRQENRNTHTPAKSWVNAGIKTQDTDVCRKCGWTRRDLIKIQQRNGLGATP